MTDQTCPRCSRAISRDTFVCGHCTSEAQKDLAETADFLLWCDEKRARLGTNWTNGSTGKAAETPLPYDPRVTKVVTPIRNALTTWARITVKEYDPQDEPPAELDMLASWLIDFCGWMATKEWSHDAFDEFQTAHEQLRILFDRPPEKAYLGACKADSEEHGECVEALYAALDSATVTCPHCGTTHLVNARRDQLAQDVDAHLGTIKEISRLLRVSLGEDVSVRMIYGYADHRLINSHGQRMERTKDGQARLVNTYRIGEVRRAAALMQQDKAQRRLVTRLAKLGVA